MWTHRCEIKLCLEWISLTSEINNLVTKSRQCDIRVIFFNGTLWPESLFPFAWRSKCNFLLKVSWPHGRLDGVSKELETFSPVLIEGNSSLASCCSAPPTETGPVSRSFQEIKAAFPALCTFIYPAACLVNTDARPPGERCKQTNLFWIYLCGSVCLSSTKQVVFSGKNGILHALNSHQLINLHHMLQGSVTVYSVKSPPPDQESVAESDSLTVMLCRGHLCMMYFRSFISVQSHRVYVFCSSEC